MRARIAWAVVGVVVVATVLDTVFTAAHRSLWNEATWAEHGWPLTPLASLGCALMGALIVRRHPAHPIGWLLSVASLLSVTLAADAYGIWALDGGDPGREVSGHLALWAAPLLGWPAFAALVLVFLLAPDGRLPSPRWRWAVWVTGAGLALHTLGTLTTPPGDFVYGQRDSTRAITEPLLTLGWMLVAVGLIASAVSLVVRLRRSRDDVRRQLLWVASAAALLAVGVVAILAVPRVTGVEGTWLAALPLRVAQVAVPLCVAVAVLRHRLLEIDMIVNRAVVLALATVLVAAGYVLVVVTVGLAVDGDQRLLALPARDRRGGAGLPAPAELGGPGGRPAGVRHRGRAVRSAHRLQSAPRQQPRPLVAAAGGGRGRGACGQCHPGSGRAPRRRRRRPGGELAARPTG